MNIEQYKSVLKAIDEEAEGNAYTVHVWLMPGDCFEGAITDPDERLGLVRLDGRKSSTWIDIAAITAIGGFKLL